MSRNKVDLGDLKNARLQPVMERELRLLRAQIAKYSKRRREYRVDYGATKIIRFGLCGDPHIGSRYERVDAMLEFYKLCRSEGITSVYNTGDIIDGWGVYRGQAFEQYTAGYKPQLDALEERYPRINGITTYFITGNHDESIKKLVNADVGGDMVKIRPDFVNMGEGYATVTMENKVGYKFKLGLVHPSGGTAYALSYHPQKYIESLAGGTKPNAMAFGHYHKSELIPDYRNVVSFQAGCFQSQTPFMKGRGLAAQVGGWIVEVIPSGMLTHRIKAEWIGFFEPTN